jgi:hypothetical protein
MEQNKMNKRLNRLIDQAGFIKFTVEEDPETPIDWSCDYTEELNKFAELIIQECLRMIENEAAQYAEPV